MEGLARRYCGGPYGKNTWLPHQGPCRHAFIRRQSCRRRRPTQLFAVTGHTPSSAQADGAAREGGTAARPARYAILGAGIAGIATAWHLLNEYSQRAASSVGSRPIEVHVFDQWGIASGGSGAAAGLLHPFSPKGQVLWEGEAAFHAALELIRVAETWTAGSPHTHPRHPATHTHTQSASQSNANSGSQSPVSTSQCQLSEQGDQSHRPFVWRTGMVRPAANPKQAKGFARLPGLQGSTLMAHGQADAAGGTAAGPQALSTNGTQHHIAHSSALPQAFSVSQPQLEQLVPGINCPATAQPTHTGQPPQPDRPLSRKQRRQQAANATTAHPQQAPATQPHADAVPPEPPQSPPAGLWIPQGVVIDVPHYLTALWSACQQYAASSALPAGSRAVLHTGQRVESLAHLVELGLGEGGGDGGVIEGREGGGGGSWDGVVVAAGAAVGTLPELRDVLPLQLCQGFTLVLEPHHDNTSVPYGPTTPSILGSQYIASQQQGTCLLVGATKTYGWTAEQTLQGGAPASRVIPLTGTTTLSRHGSDGSHEVQSVGGSIDSVSQAAEMAGGAVEHTQAAVAAAAELRAAGQRIWRHADSWQAKEVRSGVRALPPRTPKGSLPLLGRVDDRLPNPWTHSEPILGRTAGAKQVIHGARSGSGWPAVWVVAGLGSRGIVYHAWLGKQIAQAALTGREDCIHASLLRWKSMTDAKTALTFETP